VIEGSIDVGYTREYRGKYGGGYKGGRNGGYTCPIKCYNCNEIGNIS